MWLLALSVGIANACLPNDTQASAAQGMVMPGGAGHDESPSANCLQFCANDTPVFSKLQLAPDQPSCQPLLVPTFTSLHMPARTPQVPVVQFAHPPPGVPVLLRSLLRAL